MTEEFLKKHMIQICIGGLLLLLMIIWAGTFYQKSKVEQYAEILQQEKFKYKKEIESLKNERDDLMSKLEPFRARADLRFPESARKDRLNLLVMKLDETNFSTLDARRPVASDRVIPDNDRFYISNRLKNVPKLELEIVYPQNDPEGGRLAIQIKDIFHAAGWQTKTVYPSDFNAPVRSMVVEFGEKPPQILQKALAPLYDSLGYKREAFLNLDLPKNGMKIIVGHS